MLGRYELGAVIGRGGAATVYSALDRTGGFRVAVKEIPVGHEMARRAGAEVRAACRLDHPGIVSLLDFGEDTHAAYLVSELVDGDTLAHRYRAGDIDDRSVLGMLADVFGGLAHAHERGVTHRDIKPGNILVARDGRAKLTDFGIARIVGDTGLTRTGGLVGTMAYMAPEHARGEQTGPWSDVYSCCLVLREGLTGSNPQAGADHVETLRRAGAGVTTPLRSERPDLSRRLCEVVDAGLSRDPARRPAAAEIGSALERAAVGASPARRGRSASSSVLAGVARVRMPVRLASAVLVGVSTWIAVDQIAPAAPAPSPAIAAGVAAGFAVVPWLTVIVGWIVAMALLASAAPAIAALAGLLGLAVALPFRGRGHLLAIPVVAPVIAALGLVPLIAVMAGLVRGAVRRTLVAVSASAAVVAWQVVLGADPALDGGRTIGAWPDLRGRADPVHVVRTVGDVALARPSLILVAAMLTLGALVVPFIVRLRSGIPRVLGVLAWIAGLVIGVGAMGGSVENVLGALLPGGILVAVGAAVPWQRLGMGARPLEAVTLGATMDRRPTT